VVAADFTLEMMRVGKQRAVSMPIRNNEKSGPPPGWTGADTYALPFPSRTFDAVTAAFLLRNLTDPAAALREQARVLKPNGRLVVVDATPAPASWLRPFIRFYLNRIVPVMGGWITGHPPAYRSPAYRWLPDSIAGFRPRRPVLVHFEAAAAIAQLFRDVGLQQVRWQSFMSGVAAMVVGVAGGSP
jgi:demethylmenaquinone methyltransferase/2-methoxy-6-polyprenyl-1,4-benzoquinol methylase